MDNIFIYAQLAGFVAMCFSLTAWQLKKQEHILMCYVPSSFFWSIQFYLLGSYNGALFSLVGALKDTALVKSNKKYLKYIVGAFIAFNIVLVTMFFKTAYDILPLIICLLVNIPLLKKDNRYWMARCNILAQCCWIVFNLHAGAYMGLICSSLVIASALIGMARVEEWDVKGFINSIFIKPQTYP